MDEIATNSAKIPGSMSIDVGARLSCEQPASQTPSVRFRGAALSVCPHEVWTLPQRGEARVFHLRTEVEGRRALGIPAIGVGAVTDGEAAPAYECWPSTEERRRL